MGQGLATASPAGAASPPAILPAGGGFQGTRERGRERDGERRRTGKREEEKRKEKKKKDRKRRKRRRKEKKRRGGLRLGVAGHQRRAGRGGPTGHAERERKRVRRERGERVFIGRRERRWKQMAVGEKSPEKGRRERKRKKKKRIYFINLILFNSVQNSTSSEWCPKIT